MSHRLFAKTLVFIFLMFALWWNQESGLKAVARETSETAIETRSALCAFKLDLQGRYDRGASYVEGVREGRRILIQGITLAELDQSLANQRSVLNSLGSLDCSSGD